MRNPEYARPQRNSEIVLNQLKGHAIAYNKDGAEFRAFSDWIDLMTIAGQRNSTTDETTKEHFDLQIKKTKAIMHIQKITDEKYAESHNTTRDHLVVFHFHWNREQNKLLSPGKLEAIQPEAVAKLIALKNQLIS